MSGLQRRCSNPPPATASHRLYSETRQAWLPAGHLHAGELLRTATGQVTVQHIEALPGIRRVYNIEVETEHCFFAGAGEVLSHNTQPCVVSLAMEQKILMGEQIPGTREIRGGHSAEISNSAPNYAVQEPPIPNPNGTRNVKFLTELPGGGLSKIKKSTLFPTSWTDAQVISSIKQAGDLHAYSTRILDRATFHKGVVNGIDIEVIRIGDTVTSGYPTGN